jgi:hypothetical protein
MRILSRISIALVFLLFPVLEEDGSAEVFVGLAKADITPPVGGLTAGYSAAKPTEGIHDPITARVMILQSDKARVAMVVCDLCVYNSPRLHERAKSMGIDKLLLMNTHTHAGPKMNQDDFPTADKPWRDTVDERILDAIQTAQKSMFKASFVASESQIRLGYNRLVQRGAYAVTYFENPDRIPYGNVDSQVGVIRVTDDQKKVRAVLVNYACHPVVLGPRNLKISSDYPGVTRDIIEADVGSDCMCLFVQAGAGDINPLIMARGENRDKDFEDVERLGELLAVEVKRALSFAKELSAESISFEALSNELKFRNRWNPSEEMTMGVTTLLINHSIGIFTMPGEPFHQFQVDFRNKSGLRHAYLFGYCCDGPYNWPKYLPDLQSAARGGYGASDTTEAEVGAGERLMNQGLTQLFQLQGRLKPTPQRHTFDKEPND